MKNSPPKEKPNQISNGKSYQSTQIKNTMTSIPKKIAVDIDREKWIFFTYKTIYLIDVSAAAAATKKIVMVQNVAKKNNEQKQIHK